jgi:hypothetical protein
VNADGTPANSEGYDYRQAARDALHFATLFDRFVQNMRRFVGRDVQYFAVVEPQRRLAPHIHIALRGTLARAELRQVLAATYHQVWWPDTSTVRFDGDHLPIWDEHTLTKVGLTGVHFHDLRHTGNTLTADAGANLRELMERMGARQHQGRADLSPLNRRTPAQDRGSGRRTGTRGTP